MVCSPDYPLDSPETKPNQGTHVTTKLPDSHNTTIKPITFFANTSAKSNTIP
jgi:hypothetical protein